MTKARAWTCGVLGGLLLAAAHGAAYAQINQVERNQPGAVKRPPAATRNVQAVRPQLGAALPAIQLGSEKIASFKTAPGWQYTFGTADVMLLHNGVCLVTCSLDVQSHVLTGYLTFRTARRHVGSGTSESDDGWAMDVPVPISQGSASATYSWDVAGGQAYQFGCRSLADRGFLGIDVYPSVSWICR